MSTTHVAAVVTLLVGKGLSWPTSADGATHSLFFRQTELAEFFAYALSDSNGPRWLKTRSTYDNHQDPFVVRMNQRLQWLQNNGSDNED